MIEKLLRLLKIKFVGEIPLADGTMIRVEGDIVVGTSVYVESPDGSIPLPDGDYSLETGEILSALDGKIAAITSPVDTTEEPDIDGSSPVGEVTIEVDAAIGDNLPPIVEVEPIMEPKVDPEVEKLKGLVDELMKRLDDLESKISVKAESEIQMRSELDFIKTKTLATELKKSKDIEDKPVSRFDVIKNLKNK